MPVTRRAGVLAPVQPSVKTRTTRQQVTPVQQVSLITENATLSPGHCLTKAKRKASTSSAQDDCSRSISPIQRGMQQNKVCEHRENAAPCKRQRIEAASSTKSDSGQEAVGLKAAGTSSSTLSADQSTSNNVSDFQAIQSPSRPPLVPRTPATADRTGRNPCKFNMRPQPVRMHAMSKHRPSPASPQSLPAVDGLGSAGHHRAKVDKSWRRWSAETPFIAQAMPLCTDSSEARLVQSLPI